MSLPDSLERAASALDALADSIRPANGDPDRLLEALGEDEANALLRWLLEHEAAASEELVEAWSDASAGVAILVSVSDEGLPKAARKLLRRVRHRLRSSGHAVPEPSVTPRRSVLETRDDFEFASVSAPDFRGTRMAYLAEPHPSGGARLFEIRFDPSRGILDFKVYSAGRSKVRGFLRSLSSAKSHRLFDVPRAALGALVLRASRAVAVDRPLPTGFVEWRARLFPDSLEKEPTPGALARTALGTTEPALETAAASVESRIRESELGPWPPSTRWLTDRMESGRASFGEAKGDARRAAIEAFEQEIARELAEETDLDFVVHALEEAAWIDWQAQDEAGARALLVVASALPADDGLRTRLAAARGTALFRPFVAELVAELEATEAGSKAAGEA